MPNRHEVESGSAVALAGEANPLRRAAIEKKAIGGGTVRSCPGRQVGAVLKTEAALRRFCLPMIREGGFA